MLDLYLYVIEQNSIKIENIFFEVMAQLMPVVTYDIQHCVPDLLNTVLHFLRFDTLRHLHDKNGN